MLIGSLIIVFLTNKKYIHVIKTSIEGKYQIKWWLPDDPSLISCIDKLTILQTDKIKINKKKQDLICINNFDRNKGKFSK